MKKLKRKVLGGLIGSTLLGISMPIWAAEGPKVNIQTEELKDGTLAIRLQLEEIPVSAKALEIGFTTDDVDQIKEANWNTGLDDSYKLVKTLDKQDKDKQVIVYLSAPKDQVLLEEQQVLEVGNFIYEMNLQGNVDFVSGSGYIKVINKENVPIVYDKLDLVHEHKAIENKPGEEDKPDEEDKPGEENKPDEGNKPNGGGSGSSTGSTNKPNRPTKPEEPEKPEIPNVEFLDTTSHWAAEEIGRMAGRGILKGYEDGTFGPSKQITRGEFATVMARAFNLESSVDKAPFKDVAEGKWYTDSVTSLYEKGIVNGREDGTFGVNDRITNQEMAVMIARGLEAMNISFESKREYAGFLDQDKISPFARDAVKVLYELEIISGMPDGTFQPKTSATRAQVAVMMDRILAVIE